MRVQALVIAGVLAAVSSATPALAQLAVRGETVHTMAGPAIEQGLVLIGANGKIERVGRATEVAVPAGYRELRARVVTPGLVDAHTTVGLAGYLNQRHDQMEVETSAAIQPELSAVDAYNAEEKLVEWLRLHGVTTVHTGHAPAALVSGQTMIVKTHGRTVEEAIVVPEAMIAATLGTAGLGAQGRAPGTRSKAVAMLRTELVKAREYGVKRGGPEDKRPARDLRLEALLQVLRKEVPLLVTADRVADIGAALRLAKEFDIRLVLDSASEAYLVADAIKAAGVPVILHAPMARSGGDGENRSMETASLLEKAGVPFALQSGYETYVPRTRVVLFEAAVAAANGLTFDQALASVTIEAARILGIDSRVGSIASGKDADLALFDGDPFEYTSHVTGVIIDGKVVSETVQ